MENETSKEDNKIFTSAIAALHAISPIDGRYEKVTKELSQYSSEFALIKYRLFVEMHYFIQLHNVLDRKLDETQTTFMKDLYLKFTDEDALAVKAIEKTTNHDTKSVEEYMRLKMKESGFFTDLHLSHVHFGLTSWDVDNCARTLMLSKIIELVFDKLIQVHDKLVQFAGTYKNTPLLARTHGQPASPTTLGKELFVFAARVPKVWSQIEPVTGIVIEMKFGGANGNMNAHQIAYPKINWRDFAEDFVDSFRELEEFRGGPCEFLLNKWTTQIDSYDSYANCFNIIKQTNLVWVDMCRDIWTYISNGLIVQTPKKNEVGSSTMPHKINPIDFENAEGNLLFANAQLEFYSNKLPVSRLQRDLSDSTIVRNIGMTLSYCLIAYNSLLKGLGKIKPNVEAMARELEQHPEVITEAYQTILRREAIPDAYDKLKEISRLERGITMEDLHRFVDSLEVSDEIKNEMKAITPANYLGYAEEIVSDELEEDETENNEKEVVEEVKV